MRKTERELRDAFIRTARAQIGYRSVPGVGTSTYGSWAGYPQGQWDGAFLDWCANQHGLMLPRMTDTNAALSQYVRTGRLYLKPQIGDIAFTHPDVQFGQPRVGLVTDIHRGGATYTVLRGMEANPQPRANQDPVGIYELQEGWGYGLGFGRPRYKQPGPWYTEKHPEDNDTVGIRPSDVQVGRKNAKVTTLQMALAKAIGAESMTRGSFDKLTRAWYAEWQRQCGLVGPDANGHPDAVTLGKLADRTGLFTLKEA